MVKPILPFRNNIVFITMSVKWLVLPFRKKIINSINKNNLEVIRPVLPPFGKQVINNRITKNVLNGNPVLPFQEKAINNILKLT